jgi:ribosomal protein L15
MKSAKTELTPEQAAGLTAEQKELRSAGKPFLRRLVVGKIDGVRILGDGELTRKLTVKADHFSKTAKEKIEKAGGTCDLVAKPKPPVRNKMKPRPPKPSK